MPEGDRESDAIIKELDVAGGIQLKPGIRYTIKDNLTINNPISSHTGILVVPAGKTLTVNAPVRAGNNQVFDVAAPVRASCVMTCTGNFANGETIVIGGTYTYTFQTVLTNVDKHVLLGANLAASLTNLCSAINQEPYANVRGVTYAQLTNFNSKVYAVVTATTLTLTARTAGVAGNAITTTETCANASFAHATLVGGADGGLVQFAGGYTGSVNVRWYGAGLGSGNDDIPINAAIQSASPTTWGAGGEFTGCLVRIPGGDYIINQTLHVGDNRGISFLGDGKTKSNIIPSTAMISRFAPMLHFEGNNNYRGFVKWLRITGFNGSGVATTGIRIDGNGNQIDILENWIDTHYCAIYMHPHSDSRIVGNTYEFNGVLYDVDGTDHVIISDNTMYDCGPFGFGGAEQPPIAKFTNCGHIMFQNNRFISNGGASPQSTGVIWFDNCHRCTISNNIENSDSVYVGKTISLTNCQHMKVNGNVFGKSELATVALSACTDISLLGNSYYGAHLEDTITILNSTRVRIVGEDFGVIETYGSVPTTPNTIDVSITGTSSQITINSNTLARGIRAVGTSSLTIIGNESVSLTAAAPAIRLTDCTKVRHEGNSWASSGNNNTLLVDGGTDFISMGNHYVGSTNAGGYTVVVLQTAGLIRPARMKFLGETFGDNGAAYDLTIFQASGVLIDECTGLNGVFVDDFSSERVFLRRTNSFPVAGVSYHSAPPAFGTWLAGDFVDDWTAPASTSYKRGWYYDGGSWTVQNGVRDTHWYGGFLVDAADTEALGFYGVGSAGGIARQTIAAVATDPATTMALANDLRTKLINVGLIKP